MIDTNKGKFSQTEVYESGGTNVILNDGDGDGVGGYSGTPFPDENKRESNLSEQRKKLFPRSKGLPEKLEKHLNSEKERELEALYEENRQLLMEITKLRKTNQLLAKDVTKKKEIIDSLDSSLVEAEEKLENAKKKNWNMYNEILTRERKIQQAKEAINVSEKSCNLKAPKFGAFNTVDVAQTPCERNKVAQRPKSICASTPTENTKWFQEIILESLTEKQAEKKAYNDLKYEIEKLQKEVYSMQNDILKNSRQDANPLDTVNDPVNGKSSVFQSTNSSKSTLTSGCNALHSTSLAQELKDVASNPDNNSLGTNTFNDEENNNDANAHNYQVSSNYSGSSIPPRSVHILMGKTFSKENIIDRKINHYKNIQISQDSKTKCAFNKNPQSWPFQTANSTPSIQEVPLESQPIASSNHPFLTQTLPLTSGLHPPAHRLSPRSVFQSFTRQQKPQLPLQPQPLLPQLPLQNLPQHHLPQHHLPQHHLPQHHLPQHHLPQHHLPQHHLPQQALRIKVTQKFRRNRNGSVPPTNDFPASLGLPRRSTPPEYPEDCSINCPEQNDLPQGYIRFKTSVTSPINQGELFSPASCSPGMSPCPCDRAPVACIAMHPRKALKPKAARSLSSGIPAPRYPNLPPEILRFSRL